MKIFLDFETYSEANLEDVGAWAYSLHKSTEILCLSWRAGNTHDLWTPNRYDQPGELFNLIKSEGHINIVAAHNAFFEKCIWQNVGMVKHGWPSIQEHQWRCTAAKAAACAIPRNLHDAGTALSLTTIKNADGHRIMLKLAKPGKKGRHAGTPEEWEALYAYCENDTAAEQALDNALPDLSPHELAVWRADQRINLRGIPCDVKGARKAIALIEIWTAKLNEELEALTNGAATSATQRDRILGWLNDNGIAIEDMQANTLDALLEKLEPSPIRRVIEIKRSIGRSSNAKYTSVVNSASNGRMHDTLLYHGARTGRWTAKRFQPQNLVRGQISNMERAWDTIHEGKIKPIIEDYFYSDPMQFLSYAIRGVIRAEEGYQLYSADYSAIETRALFWFAEEERGLEILRKGEDIYLDMASVIYGRTVTKAEDVARQLGKQAILGLGFRMGFVKYLQHCRTYRLKFDADFVRSVVPQQDRNRLLNEIISENMWAKCVSYGMTRDDVPELILMKYIVDKYRARYNSTVGRLWEVCDNAPKQAMRNPGQIFAAGKYLKYRYDRDRFLMCRLPSGRILYYPYPILDNNDLSCMSVNAINHQWQRERLWGAKFVENCVQGTARDIMAEAILRCENTKYEVIMSVHDEVVAQSKNGNVKEFINLIAQVPQWASGFPVRAEGWAGTRYRK